MSFDDSVQSFLTSKPHTVIGFAWISSWMQQLHYLVDAHESMKEYHLYLTHANHTDESNVPRFGEDMLRCVRDFYDYFLVEENIVYLTRGDISELKEDYGHDNITLPLKTLVALLTDKEKVMFRALTIDVYLAIANPYVAIELEVEWTSQQESINTSLLT